MKFQSTFSPLLALFLIIVLGGLSVSMLWNRLWLGFSIIQLQVIFIFYLYRKTAYILEDEWLVIQCGFFYSLRIPYADIKRIRKTANPISSPAWSFKRIQIDYGKMSSVIISPNTIEQFLNSIEPYVNKDVIMRTNGSVSAKSTLKE